MAKFNMVGDWLSGTQQSDGSFKLDTTGAGASATTYLAGSAGTPMASLAGNTGTTPVTIPANSSASYGFSYLFGGTSPSLKLQSLGADGSTWQDVVTVTASGSQGVVVFTGSAGASMRLLNNTSNAITNLTASLSS